MAVSFLPLRFQERTITTARAVGARKFVYQLRMYIYDRTFEMDREVTFVTSSDVYLGIY